MLALLLLQLLPIRARAETCRASEAPALIARVRNAEDRGAVLGTFASRDACFEAWGARLRRGELDESRHLACVTRQTVVGESRTELKALDFQTADALCLRLNVCLFDLYERRGAAYRTLAGAWDRLSCMGH